MPRASWPRVRARRSFAALASLFDSTGVVAMTNSAFVACLHIRTAAVCGLLSFALAACGGGAAGSSSSGTTAATTAATSLVSPGAGLIDRSPAASGATSGTVVASNTVAKPGTAQNGSAPSQPATSGVATLDWEPPTRNSDGSVLTDLAGYTVYYGTSPTNLSQKVKIGNPGLSAYTLTNLAPGTWYFAVTTSSASGSESALSTIISTTI